MRKEAKQSGSICALILVLLAGIITAGCDGLPGTGGTSLSASSDAPATPTALRALGSIEIVTKGVNEYFRQTGHAVTQPFLKFWHDNGGVAIFGYPISDLTQEGSADTGEKITVQYFERARFELHRDTGDKVVLGRLGALVHSPQPRVKAIKGAQYFTQTGHNVSGAFRRFWNEHGGVAIFGYPITEPLLQRSATDGKTYTVQYFERARFEYHPEFAGTPNEVQLGQLGREVRNRSQQ